MGLTVEPSPAGCGRPAPDRLRSTDVATLPYPGVATDYKPLITAMLAVADGVGIVTENLFAGRFRYVEELVRMGADIRTDSHHAVVRGVPRLVGTSVRASDIRAGAALVVAGLAAEGETSISAAHHIDRGYENIVGKLRRSAPTSSASTELRRHPPLRFGWLLLASLGNASGCVDGAPAEPDATGADAASPASPPLRFGWLLLASLGNASGVRCGAPAEPDAPAAAASPRLAPTRCARHASGVVACAGQAGRTGLARLAPTRFARQLRTGFAA